MLVTGPNEAPLLYQLACHSLTWRTCRRESVALLDNLSWRWAKLPPRSHDNPTPQLLSNKLKAPFARLLAMVHASPTNPCVTLRRVLQTAPLHLSDGNPLLITELSRSYLKSRRLSVVTSGQPSQWRSPSLPVLHSRAMGASFDTACASSLRDQMRLSGLSILAVPITR